MRTVFSTSVLVAIISTKLLKPIFKLLECSSSLFLGTPMNESNVKIDISSCDHQSRNPLFDKTVLLYHLILDLP